MRATLIVSPGLVGLVCLALAGCTPSAPGAATPTPTPAPTTAAPTETPAAVHEPASRYGLECDDLVDEALATGTFSVAVAAVDPLVTASGVGIAIPRRTSILSQGGMVCEWSNGVAMNTQYGYVPGYVGLVVSVTPRPDAGWSAQAAANGMPSDARACEANTCTMSTTAGDAWVTLEASGGDGDVLDPAAADALFDAAVAEIVAAGAPEPAVTPERSVPPLPTDCEAVLPLATVRSISGIAAAEPRVGSGGWSDWAEARLDAGNEGCDWGVGDAETAATVDWVRDGRWAYDRAAAAGTFTPVTIAGLGVDDLASVRCDPAFGPSCTVDIALGPDWVSVAGNDQPTATALAEAVVAQLAP
jgi:hypothetical protein